jgi:hypothetical protein
MAERSKASAVFDRSSARGRGFEYLPWLVCTFVFLLCLCCHVQAFAIGLSPVQEVLAVFPNISQFQKLILNWNRTEDVKGKRGRRKRRREIASYSVDWIQQLRIGTSCGLA